MKTRILLFITMMLLLAITGPAAAVKIVPENADVASVFAAQNKQPFTRSDGSIENLDTIWIYLTDGSFVQYAFIDDQAIIFSEGTYHFTDGGDFLFEEQETGKNDIVITRTAKYVDGEGLKAYSSEHTYGLGTLGFRQIFSPEQEGKKIVAIFAGPGKQPWVDDAMLDTYWIYFDDMTFKQYACLEMLPIPFSEGSYVLSEGADFRFDESETDYGTITISRTMKFQPDLNYADYASEHSYGLNRLGFSQLILDEE